MKTILITTALTMSLAAATTARADCAADIAAFPEEHGETLSALTNDDRPVVRSLMNAARDLSANGYDEVCASVLDSLEEYVEARAEEGVGEPAPVEGAADGATDGTETVAETEAEAEIEAGTVDLTAAGNDWARKDLVGTYVYGIDEEYLGAVEGALVGEGGKLSHLIVATGGLLGIGDREVAVPVTKIKAIAGEDWLYVPMTQDQLEKAPDYDETDGEWTIDNNDGYYDAS